MSHPDGSNHDLVILTQEICQVPVKWTMCAISNGLDMPHWTKVFSELLSLRVAFTLFDSSKFHKCTL